MSIPSAKRVASEYVRTSPKVRTAGEVRFVKDRSGDDATEWAWGSPTPPERSVSDYSGYKPKFLKPLVQTLRSCLMALGHATSAHVRMVKIKSLNISTDGSLGGKGYIMKIPEMRRQLMNCVEVLSAISDTLYDEVNAPHWKTTSSKLEKKDQEEVEDIMENAEEIRKDPETWAEEEEAEELEEFQEEQTESSGKSKVASRTRDLNLEVRLASKALSNLPVLRASDLLGRSAELEDITNRLRSLNRILGGVR